MIFFKKISKMYGPSKLKIGNRFPRRPSYFVKELIHILKIKIGHSEVSVIYHRLLV